jgi:hypothetical protein
VGIAGGSVLVSAVLTNTSHAACTLRGYPLVRLVGESGRPRATHVVHAGLWPPDHPELVRLAPRGRASFTIQYSQVPAPGVRVCPIAGLRITPPGGSGARLVRSGISDCRHGRFAVSAIHAGTRGALGATG